MWLVFLTAVSLAQVALPTFTHLLPEDGLSQSTVWALAQDHNGVVWIGTNCGLNRHDGRRIKIFKRNLNEANSIGDNQVRCLYVDRAGFLWVGTQSGVDRVDVTTEQITNFKHVPGDPNSLSFSYVYCINEDRNGGIWVGTSEGLNRLDPESGRFRQFIEQGSEPGLSDNTIRALTFDDQGRLWVGTLRGVNRYDPETDHFRHYLHDPGNPQTLSHDQVRALLFDGDGQLWVGTSKGLNRMDPITGKVTRFVSESQPMSDDWINTMVMDGGVLWMGTFRGGLLRHDLGSSEFQAFRKSSDSKVGPISDNVISLMRDRSGLLWIGSFSAGASQLDLNPAKFDLYGEDQRSGRLRQLHALFESPHEDLYVGTQQGLHVFYGDGRQRKYDRTSVPPLDEDQIRTIALSQNDELWLGTYAGGAVVIDQATQTKRTYLHDPNNADSIASDFVYAIIRDRRGDMLLGTRSGVDRFLAEENRFEHLEFADRDELDEIDLLVHCILRDQNQRLWVGSESGLCLMEPEFRRYRDELPSPKILNLAQDPSHKIWIGTNHGLSRLDPEAATFEHFGVEQGLSGDNIYSILPLSDSDLWVSTNAGLAHITLRGADIEIESFSVSDGLQGNDFFEGVGLIRRSGELMFGGVNGLNGFFPGQIQRPPYEAPLVLTSFKALGREMIQGITRSASFELSPQDNQIAIEFAALDYRVPSNVNYAYRLVGYDNQWHYPGTGRLASYGNLPYRQFTFELRATNSDRVWGQETLRVPIRIAAPFYRTALFLIALAVLLAVIVWSLHRLRVRRIRKLNMGMALIVDQKTAELEQTQHKLVETAHRAGILQIANGVLSQVSAQLSDLGQLSGAISRSLDPEPVRELKEYQRAFNELSESAAYTTAFVGDMKRLESLLRLQRERTQALVQQLLNGLLKMRDMIRIQHDYGMVPIHLESIDVCSVIADTLKLMNPDIESRSISLVTECEPVAGCVMSKIKLNQILTKLIQNSVEAMDLVPPENRELVIRFGALDDHSVELKVSDRGCGIEDEKISQVLRYGYSSKPGHDGFGLHEVANLVNELGGQVHVGNRRYGGCSIKLIIPKRAGTVHSRLQRSS